MLDIYNEVRWLTTVLCVMYLKRYVHILQESITKNIDVNLVMFDKRIDFTKITEEAFVRKLYYWKYI